MTQLRNSSLKELHLGDIQDPAVRDAIRLLLTSTRQFANQAATAVNDNEPGDLVYTAPTFLNAWVNFNAAWEPAGYTIDPYGTVHLKGTVANGVAAAAIFNLPVGYRPALNNMFSVVANNAFGRLDVESGGDVILRVGAVGFVNLSGVSFKRA